MSAAKTAYPLGAALHSGPANMRLAELAAQDGGPGPASSGLESAPMKPARGPEPAAALWRSALKVELEPAALTGVGRFAYADRLEDTVWLELTAWAVVQQPGALLRRSSSMIKIHACPQRRAQFS